MAALFNRFHLATRIHFALLRAVGEGVDVRRMMRERSYADQVIMMCQEFDGTTLAELAERFDDLSAAEDARDHLARAASQARAAHAQLGFGPTAPSQLQPAGRGRIARSRWSGLGHSSRH